VVTGVVSLVLEYVGTLIGQAPVFVGKHGWSVVSSCVEQAVVRSLGAHLPLVDVAPAALSGPRRAD